MNTPLLTPSARRHTSAFPTLMDTISTLFSLSSDVTVFGNGLPHDANFYLRRLLYQDPLQQCDPYAVQSLTNRPEHHSPWPAHSPDQVHANGRHFLISTDPSSAAPLVLPVPPPLATTLQLVHIGPIPTHIFLPRDPMAQYNSLVGLARHHDIIDPAIIVNGQRFVPASASINQAAHIFVCEALATSTPTPDTCPPSPPDVASVSNVDASNPATITVFLVDITDSGFFFPATFPHSTLHNMSKSIERVALTVYPPTFLLLHGRQVFNSL